MGVAGQNGRGFMNHAGIVEQQRGERLLHHKAQAVRPVGLKHAGFTAFDALPCHQQHHDKIHAVSVRALGCGPADAFLGVDAELVRFDMPAGRGGPHCGKQTAQSALLAYA